MSSRFQCTACGKCCYGSLPLTLKDAFVHADKFPLCFVWTPVLEGSKDFAHTAKLGITVKLPNRKSLAALIVPTSFIPKDVKCPSLGADNLCSIHATKPLRCKAMPFYPYREERFQSELLQIRPGWKCDVSDNAPVVLSEKKLIDRTDFDAELKELLGQVPLIRRYFDYMQKYQYTLIQGLGVAASQRPIGYVVTSLSSFLTATRHPEAKQIAASQVSVLEKFADQTADQPQWTEFHQYYKTWAKELSFLSQRP